MSAVRARRFPAIEKRLLASLRIAQEIVSAGSTAGVGVRRLEAILHEAGFMRAFVAWERFLEDVFLSYMMGQRPISGRAPHRYYEPPNSESAWDFLRMVAGRRPYLNWTEPTEIAQRAQVVFRNGGCFSKLQAQNQVLQDMKRVRNAISHDSDIARAKFEELVRKQLTTLPPGCTPGSLLGARNPNAGAHGTFLDTYLDVIRGLARNLLRP